jgi:hypothetical protein
MLKTHRGSMRLQQRLEGRQLWLYLSVVSHAHCCAGAPAYSTIDDERVIRGPDMDEIESTVLPCLPIKCRRLIKEIAIAILPSSTSTEGGPYIGIDTITTSLGPLLKGLLTSFSVVVMLPWLALDSVRAVCADPERKLRSSGLRHTLQDLCPEVYRALADTYKNCKLIFPFVKQFVDGLCDSVDTWARCAIEPPDFHAIPRSYNPEATGMALHLTQSRLQGRVTRRYVSDEAGDRAVCNKEFKTSRGRTGGLFRYLPFICTYQWTLTLSNVTPL